MRFKMTLIAFAILHSVQPDASADEIVPSVPLAKNYHDGVDVSEYWYSEKLDGIRAYWTGQHLVTRKGHRIHAPGWFTQVLPDYPLDGELWAGRGNFHVVQQTVLDIKPIDTAWRKIDFMIFDMPHSAGNYEKRYYNIQSLVLQIDQPHIKYVKHRAIRNEQHLFEQLDRFDQSRGEGIMLRKISSRYQAGRGSDLLKLKRFQDEEAVVVGYKPGSGRLLGMMGALLVQLKDGSHIYIGSGFTDEIRRAPPKLDTTITFRFNGYTQTGKPRFPRYVRERIEH
ncbi:DNA ligase [Vibrio sp. CAU 1672]|uniref:DNA ligase n=1 Tax=Vibrio sp. CAU 1672 TaxID=3032594 RepID=UPI0023D9F0B5|nr:DNA ligase [Vibrio sp. CAU 1672]MDF2152166.1 DNA ligase [Vibrio sp. CAU 1672]